MNYSGLIICDWLQIAISREMNYALLQASMAMARTVAMILTSAAMAATVKTHGRLKYLVCSLNVTPTFKWRHSIFKSLNQSIIQFFNLLMALLAVIRIPACSKSDIG